MLGVNLYYKHKRSIFNSNLEVIEIAAFQEEIMDTFPIRIEIIRKICQGALMQMALTHVDLGEQEGGKIIPIKQKKRKNMKISLYFRFKQKSNQIELHFKLQFYNKRQRDVFIDWLYL